ncbi:MAG: hypothetical protein QOK16_1986 [Solirubrobacteraceae bacterium]|nr:hypothetical protein [Solirubrobacteraceae bacterium]MEA2186975.1 hypothetical protein [Solirubrobacteraceae bacterium]
MGVFSVPATPRRMQNLRVTPALELDRVADELNDRPRKRFAFANNTNGLLRQYIPKGTDVATVTEPVAAQLRDQRRTARGMMTS